MANNLRVRDFLYVDEYRLYSLYSQVFEGVTEKIIESYEAQSSSSDLPKKPILSGSQLETKVAEASLRSENKSLYDFMYSKLEEKISTAIVDLNSWGEDRIKSEARKSFLIRIQGPAQIWDYARLESILKDYNKIGEAIAFSNIDQEEIDKYEREIDQTQDKNERVRKKEYLKILKDPKKLAKELGLTQDETQMKNLVMFSEFFYPDAFELTLEAQNSESILYRAIIKKQWLRIDPSFLRALYGDKIEDDIVIVGSITHKTQLRESILRKPDQDSQPEEPDSENEANDEAEEADQPHMRDAFKAMFDAYSAVETGFKETIKKTEFIVSPLAIFSEANIDLEK